MTDVADIIIDVNKLTRLSDVLKPEHLENLRKYLVARDEIMNAAMLELRDKAFLSTFYTQHEEINNSVKRALSIADHTWPSRFV